MEFILLKTSDDNFHKIIQLNSIEELVNFVHEINSELIIGTNANGNPILIVYDDYIE